MWRMRALPHPDVVVAVETVRSSDSAAGPKGGVRVPLVDTGAFKARSSLATWDEMDVAGAVWTIAAGRMKRNGSTRFRCAAGRSSLIPP